jgi:hypothetical protein
VLVLVLVLLFVEGVILQVLPRRRRYVLFANEIVERYHVRCWGFQY